MGDQKKGVPDALKGSRVVILSDKTEVRVLRWSMPRLLEIFDRLEGWLTDVPKEKIDKIINGTPQSAAFGFVGLIGARSMDLIRASVEKPDVIMDDFPAEDALALLEAVMDLNLTDNLVKKGMALWTRFQQLYGAQK